MKLSSFLLSISAVTLLLSVLYTVSPAPSQWVTIRTVEAIVDERIEIREVEYFNRIWLSCVALKLSVDVSSTHMDFFLPNLDSVEILSSFDRTLFDTTVSWGKKCMQDEKVREDFLRVIDNPRSYLHISDSRESLIVIDSSFEHAYYVERN